MDVTVVIPARNEANAIAATLDALGSGCRAHDYEIIVVDAGSTDDTAQIARGRGAMVIATTAVAPGPARNLGAARSQGRLLAFLDADVAVTPQWHRRMAELVAAHDRKPSITGNPVTVRDDASWLERSWFGAMDTSAERYVNCANLICDAALFRTLGGFDERLATGEEVNLCERARQVNYEVVNDPRLAAVHFRYPRTIGAFWVREAWHGTGDVVSVRVALRSKVVIAAAAFAALSILAVICAVTANITALAVAVLGVLALLLVCSAQRFRAAGWTVVIRNMPLYAVYLSARFASLVLPVASIARLKNVQNQTANEPCQRPLSDETHH